MNDGKKIVFEGSDNGVFTMMDRLKRKADEMYQSIAEDAALATESDEKRIKFITARIREIEKENKLLLDQRKLKLDLEHQRESTRPLQTSADYRQFSEFEKRYKAEKTSISNEELELKTQANFLKQNVSEESDKILREILNTLRENHEEAEFLDKKNDGAEIDADQVVVNVDGSKGSDKENVTAKKEQSIFKEVLKANLATEAIKGILNFSQNIATGTNQAESGETFAADIISQVNPLGIPIGAIMGGAMRRENEEQFAVQTAENRLKGLTGKGYAVSNPDLGFSKAETIPIMEQVARSTGKGNMDNVIDNTRDLLHVERNFSLDRGTIMQLLKDTRSASSDMSLIENVAQVVNMVPGLKKDPTKTQEFLQLQSQLFEENKNTFSTQNRGNITELISKFASINSSIFKNADTLGGVMSSVDNSLTNPGNDFAKARNFSVLSQLNPGGDYFDLIESQVSGIYQPGFLQKTLEQTQKSVGGGKNLMTAITGSEFGGGGILNLAPEAARAFVEAFEKNPQMFAGLSGTQEEIRNKLKVSQKVDQIEQDAYGKVAPREVEKEKIRDAFVEGGIEGMTMVMQQTGQALVREIRETGIKMFEGTTFEVNLSDKIADSINNLIKSSTSIKHQ